MQTRSQTRELPPAAFGDSLPRRNFLWLGAAGLLAITAGCTGLEEGQERTAQAIDRFPLIELDGNPAQRGRIYGRIAAPRIRECFDFYSALFAMPEKELKSVSEGFRARIARWLPEYAVEIDNVARGAGMPEWTVHAINARTEILTLQRERSECSAVCFSEQGLLGQTWDWAEAFVNLAVVLRISLPGGRRVLTLTEPGMLAKVGLNSDGLGVALNWLPREGAEGGIPLHVVLRACLDAPSLAEASRIIDRLPTLTAGTIFLADQKGGCRQAEICGSEKRWIDPAAGVAVHTNHFLSGATTDDEPEALRDSQARLERLASEAVGAQSRGVDGMKNLLSDGSGRYPVCKQCAPDEFFGSYGTVAAVIMDLRRGNLHFTPGAPASTGYRVESLF